MKEKGNAARKRQKRTSTQTAKAIAELRSQAGELSPDCRRRIERFLKNPTPANWIKCCDVCIAGNKTFRRCVHEVASSSATPSYWTARRALKHAAAIVALADRVRAQATFLE